MNSNYTLNSIQFTHCVPICTGVRSKAAKIAKMCYKYNVVVEIIDRFFLVNFSCMNIARDEKDKDSLTKSSNKKLQKLSSKFTMFLKCKNVFDFFIYLFIFNVSVLSFQSSWDHFEETFKHLSYSVLNSFQQSLNTWFFLLCALIIKKSLQL